MVELQQQVISKLGDSTEATAVKEIYLSKSLISDMESFKYSNPQSILEDFIRWHSPKDYIIENGIFYEIK